MNYLVIGFDIGDGESLISYQKFNDASNENDSSPELMNMPSQRPGAPMPSVLYKNNQGNWNFNRHTISLQKLSDIILNFKRQPSSIKNNIDFQQMKNNIILFVDLVFKNLDFTAIAELGAIDSIIICIGHPTKWNSEDVKLYKSILKDSVIGKEEFCIGAKSYSSRLLFFPESQAAFLFYRNETKSVNAWEMNKARLLIDIGSSTIDVTAVAGANRVYNSGSNFLGARIFEYIIYNLYYEKMKKSENFALLLDLLEENANLKKLFIYLSREVKEEYFASDFDREGINFQTDRDFRVEFQMDELKEVIEYTPIRDIIIKDLNIDLSEEQCNEKWSWLDAFENFIQQQKNELEKRQFFVNEIILTGSASQMYFIPNCCKKIFGDQVILNTLDPGGAIAKGLVFAGIATEQANSFENKAEEWIANRLESIINSKIPELGNYISECLSSYFELICTGSLLDWKEERIKTLAQVKYNVLNKTSKGNINTYLRNHKEYQKYIKEWNAQIKKIIIFELKDLCAQYNVYMDFVLEIPDSPDSINMASNIDDVIVSLIDFLLPDIIYNIMPNFLGAVFAFITLLVQRILRGVGILLQKLLKYIFGEDTNNLADVVQEKIMETNLPRWIRNKVNNKDLSFAVNDGLVTLKKNIITSIEEESNKKKIISSVKDKIRPEIQNKIKEIKYIISGETE